MAAGGSNFFYLLDAYSGVANLTSSSGAAEWTYATDPFGTGTATKNDPSAPTNVMRFDGQFIDTATGLFNLRARAYDASLARFLEIDPVPANVSEPYVASYVYSNDSPTRFSDPSGRGLIDTLREAITHFGSSYNAGYDELYEDWQAGPTAPKIVGGVMILGGLLGLACAAASAACYAVMSSPIGQSLLSQCGQRAAETIEGILYPGGQSIGTAGNAAGDVRELPGSLSAAQQLFSRLIQASGNVTRYVGGYRGEGYDLPNGGFLGLAESNGLPVIDINIPGEFITKIHFTG